jgi:hypothetical protein
MNETTILLSSSPSSGDPSSELTKPDFLATVEPLVLHRSSPAVAALFFTLPFELIINEYTRESWSLGSSSRRDGEASITIANDKKDNDDWISCYLVSTDGRNRLAGFTAYLRERKKAAVARIPSETHHNGAILVVPYDPPPIPTEILMNVKDGNQLLFVKYLKDASILQKNKDSRKCNSNNIGQSSNDALTKTQHQEMKLNHQQKQQQQQQQQKKKTNNQHLTAPQGQSTQHNQSSSTTTTITTMVSGGKKTTKGGGGGLLGNLLGAKRKTETALDMVRTSTKKSSTTTDDVTTSATTLFDPTSAAGCINTFRTKIMSDLTIFKSQSTVHVTKIPIILSTIIKPITSHDEREKITMDVLRFAIYEQVEEVGDDTWIAVKEPSDFIDECIIVVYKAGHCPPEILMEMNKGELPNEIRGAVQYMAQAETKAMERKGKKLQEAVLKNSGKNMKDQQQQQQFDDNVVILNTNKRDRRTLEQIQKDLLDEDEDVKRNRFGV